MWSRSSLLWSWSITVRSRSVTVRSITIVITVRVIPVVITVVVTVVITITTTFTFCFSFHAERKRTVKLTVAVEIASTDVPTKWAIQAGSDENAQWDRSPTEDGYGRNGTTSWDTGFSNRLKNLFIDYNRNGTIEDHERLNTNTPAPDCRTVFDTQVAHSAVTFITNGGTGVENVDQTDLQHLFVTGRTISGRNLAAAARDSGSGTRNIAMNGICVDPSFGRGENRGNKQRTASNTNLGPGTQRSNLGGSSVMENVVQNHRLALGFTGIAGGSRSAADTAAGKYEIVNLRNDFTGTDAAVHVRAGKATILQNASPDDSYRIAGEQTFATRGDPNANRLPEDTEYVANPPVFSNAAAFFLNNIKDSQRDFDPNFPSEDQFLMPGQDLARRFFSPAGANALPDPLDPCNYLEAAGFNEDLQMFMIENLDLGSGIGAPWFGDPPPFGATTVGGRVPVRKANPDFPPIDNNGEEDIYSDGNTAPGYCYFDGNDNPQTASGGQLSAANGISGDFQFDGDVDLEDVQDFIDATFAPRSWQLAGNGNGGGDDGGMVFDMAIPEVIGDMNGDGNLDKEDWRYFMDGLYIDGATGSLNREAAAIAVDDAILAYAAANLPGDPASWLPWGLGSEVRWPQSAPEWVSTDGDRCQEKTVELPGGSFGRGTLMGARPYQPGDFRADVAGRPTSQGAAPTGADGVIDEIDLAYVVANAGDWTDLFEAVEMDLSCDMNGDLKVDGLDVEFVKSILHPGGGTGPSCPPGDIRNGPDCGTDGDVDLNDILGVLDEIQPFFQ